MHYLEPRKDIIKTAFLSLTIAGIIYLWNQYVSPNRKIDEPINPANPSTLELKTNSYDSWGTNAHSDYSNSMCK